MLIWNRLINVQSGDVGCLTGKSSKQATWSVRLWEVRCVTDQYINQCFLEVILHLSPLTFITASKDFLCALRGSVCMYVCACRKVMYTGKL